MGIITDALTIVLGGLFGGTFRKSIRTNHNSILGIGIMILSIVGFLENVYNVDGRSIVSENLMIVLFSFMIGSILGDALHLEEFLSKASQTSNKSFNAFIDATLFFGIGGLQISGPILLVTNGDNSQLFLKSLIDLPFAIAYGAAYGKIAAWSAVPVAVIQLLIALTAYLFSGIFTGELIAQLCAAGYIILFFSGFNLIADHKNKINNVNMLPGIFLVILFHCISGVFA